MKWIKLTDQLPEIGKQVLLFTDSGVIEGSRDEGEKLYWTFIALDVHGCGCCARDSDEVTHWQPLMEEPK